MEEKRHADSDQRPPTLIDAMADLNININNSLAAINEAMVPQWKDVTTLLDDATKDFDVGQLVHLESLTLFDAMSAIEVMDPKMDTGMVVADNHNLFDVEKRLSADELLWVMDRLLTCEMGWIAGHSLSQTVYTCIYFHHVPTLAQPSADAPKDLPEVIYAALKAYILGVVKCRQLIWIEMTRGNIYEEEDFTTNLFGLPLYDEYLDADVLNELDAALNALSRHLDQAAQVPSVHTPNHSSRKPTEGSPNEDPLRARLEAIQYRLQARKSFMLVLMSMGRLQSTPTETTLAELSHTMEGVKKDIAQTIDLVKNRIMNTVGSGVEVEGAFDPNINRKLTSQTPPRPIVMKSDKESYEDFLLLLRRLQSICGSSEYPSVGSLVNYFLSFSSARPYPDALSRSVLNSFFYRNRRIFGVIPVEEFLMNSVKSTTNPPTWGLRPKLGKKSERELFNKRLDDFTGEASLLFVDFFKIQCHNRARQRRTLCKELAKWEEVENKAMLLDEMSLDDDDDEPETMPYYYTAWAYTMRLIIMNLVQELGAELDLYSQHELPMIYWFLEHTYDEQTALSNRIATFTEPMLMAETPSEMEAAFTRPHPNDRAIRMAQCLAQAKREMAKGTFKLLSLAQDTKTPRFDDIKTRFNHRFKPFSCFVSDSDLYRVTDRFPTCKEYKKATYKYHSDDRVEYRKLLKEAKHHLEEASGLFEVVLGKHQKVPNQVTQTEMCHEAFETDLLAMKRVCMYNRLAIMKLSTMMNVQSTLKVPEILKKNETTITTTYSFHSRWPAMEVNSKSK